MRDDSTFGIFLTTVLSHLAMVPCGMMLMRRRWLLETALLMFAMFTSFFYHTSQTFNTNDLFLTELQWHRLDNIGALSCFGILFCYFANMPYPFADQALKVFIILVSIIIQEKDPWNEKYTFGPIMTFALIPIFYHAFVRRKLPDFNYKRFFLAHTLLGISIFFFVLGLDDHNDPWRMFHGLWHLFGGAAAFQLWRVVKHPHIVSLPLSVSVEYHTAPGGEKEVKKSGKHES